MSQKKLRRLLAEEGLTPRVASDQSDLEGAAKEIDKALDILEGAMLTLEDRSQGESLADVYREAAEAANIIRRSSAPLDKAMRGLKKLRVRAAAYSGNPDGKPIYTREVDHGYEEPISGGSNVMVELVENLRREQGR